MTRLTAKFVRDVTEPGKYGDGDAGLFLMVKPSGRKSYVQRLTIHGRRRDIGLGSTRWTTLTEARTVAQANRKLARQGGDPLAAKRLDVPTFADAAERVIELHSAGWKDSGRSAGQWRASLRDYALPRLGSRTVDSINTADVMAVLLPIWNEKRETARRVRQRIGAVMKWAVAEGYRGDNPAGEAIGAALPKNGIKRTHQKALPHAEVGGAVSKVRGSDAWLATKLAFEFLVLTAARSGEVRLATWDEIDLDAETWTVPAARMKAKREHRVPLSDRALAILQEARPLSGGSGLIFPSMTSKALSDATISKLLRDLGIPAVPHGFRSSFRNWCADTGQPRELAEMALAHAVRGVEGDYWTNDILERRRAVMEAWARYVLSANVVAIRAA